MAPRAPALLVARSVMMADQVVTRDWGWKRTAIARYLTPDGEAVIAGADRSCHFIGRPVGTRIYLLPGWTLRDDYLFLRALLDQRVLVEAPLPSPPR